MVSVCMWKREGLFDSVVREKQTSFISPHQGFYTLFWLLLARFLHLSLSLCFSRTSLAHLKDENGDVMMWSSSAEEIKRVSWKMCIVCKIRKKETESFRWDFLFHAFYFSLSHFLWCNSNGRFYKWWEVNQKRIYYYFALLLPLSPFLCYSHSLSVSLACVLSAGSTFT